MTVAMNDDGDEETLGEVDAKVEQIARYIEGDGQDEQRVALADGVRSRRFEGPPGRRFDPWVTHGRSHNDHDLFRVGDQPRGVEWIDLGRDNRLGVIVDDLIVEFAVFQWMMGKSSDGSPDEYIMLLRGSGPSGSLRECRHIWWGERGYTYYLNFALVERVFKELRRWFDGD